jgi:regulator of protease activity HflC (stomatin/prohibitin superfamily)
MNSRTVIIAAVALVLIGIVLGLAFLQRSGQRKIAERQKELERDLGNLTQPMTSSIRY